MFPRPKGCSHERPTIAVIDYGAGNLRSIRRALEAAGAEVIASDPAAVDVRSADGVVLPGVGARARRWSGCDLGLVAGHRRRRREGRHFGICLGMQFLFEHQDEGDVAVSVSWPGSVRALGGLRSRCRRSDGTASAGTRTGPLG